VARMTGVIRRRAGHSRKGRPGTVGFRGKADPSHLLTAPSRAVPFVPLLVP
jgi:hypothetical protein